MGKMVGADTSFLLCLDLQAAGKLFLALRTLKKKIEVEENTRCSMPWRSPTRNLPTQINKIDH